MGFRNSVAVAAVAIAGLWLAGSSSAEAAKNYLNIDFDACALAAVGHLGQFGVKNDDVTDFNFVQISEGGKRIRIVGVEYWLRVEQCENGSVVIDMNASCRVRHAYTRSGCTIEGLKSY